jgi:hypothetical protein
MVLNFGIIAPLVHVVGLNYKSLPMLQKSSWRVFVVNYNYESLLEPIFRPLS